MFGDIRGGQIGNEADPPLDAIRFMLIGPEKDGAALAVIVADPASTWFYHGPQEIDLRLWPPVAEDE